MKPAKKLFFPDAGIPGRALPSASPQPARAFPTLGIRLSLVIIVALLLTSIALNFYAREYPLFPTHGDEWDILIFVREMQKQQTVVFYDPSVVGQPGITAGPHYRLEMNYHLFVFSLLTLTRMNPLHAPFLITTLFSFMLALGTFMLIRTFTRSNLAAFLSAIAVFALKNNVALLGYTFMAPMGFGLAMIPLLVFTFLRGLQKTSFFILFAILLCNLFFTHPVYAVLMVPVVLVFLLFRPLLLVKNFARLFLLGAALFILGLLAVQHLFRDNFSQTLIELLVYPYGPYIAQYPLIGFLHPLEFVVLGLGLLGALLFSLPRPTAVHDFFSALAGKLRTPFRPEFNFALFSLIFAVIWIYLRWYSDANAVCFFGPCRRTSTGFVILLLILVGVGTFFLSKTILETVFRAYGKWVQHVLDVVGALMVAVLLFQYILLTATFYGGYVVATPANHADFDWIKNQLPADARVIADFPMDKPIVLIGEKVLPAAYRARLGDIHPDVAFDAAYVVSAETKNPAQDIGFFYQRTCAEQELIAEKYSITHFYAQTERGCLRTNRVFDGGEWHVRERA